ncbi:mitochondrial chaperone BCS1 [Acanthamoeba castellanii medusavirus]|uniref:Mitochondrial chaperone BCS1 n=1 Tax=Acanthamoeba castellanii medusavirus J1 TaxID=3114988 RepID=A0A3T1CXN1_9VIRU|nr:mitochondrial chaperone BCS1 [Acanthamoeba castellanii medusavirus]BBI30588.1 mitochondrial chaperone BCS1 [Acanthamoeba castellanii medusavirus J1]
MTDVRHQLADALHSRFTGVALAATIGVATAVSAPFKYGIINELTKVFSDVFNPFTYLRIDSQDDIYACVMQWLAEVHDKPKYRSWLSTTGRKMSCVSPALKRGKFVADSKRLEQKPRLIISVGTTTYLRYEGHLVRVTVDQLPEDNVNAAESGFFSMAGIPRQPSAPKLQLVLRVMSRTTAPLEELIAEARRWSREVWSKHTRIYSKPSNGFPGWEVTATMPRYNIDNSKHDPAILKDIIDDIELFLSRREYYAERGMRYKRGYLFHGPPGSGKSTLINVLAAHFKMDVAVVELNGNSEHFAQTLMSAVPGNTLLVFEDIDRFGDSRGSSALLNALDGLASDEGNIIIFTANHISKLNKALMRHGRMDRRIKIGLPSRDQCVAFFCGAFAKSRPRVDLKAGRFDFSDVEPDVLEMAGDFAALALEHGLSCAEVENALGRAIDPEQVPAIVRELVEEKTLMETEAEADKLNPEVQRDEAMARMMTTGGSPMFQARSF